MRVRHLVVTATIAGFAAIAACGGTTNNSGFDDSPDASKGGGSDGSTAHPTDGAFKTDAPSFNGQDSGQMIGPGSDASLFNDGSPDAFSDGACVSGDAGAAPFPQRCAPMTADECDGTTDAFLASIGITGFNNGTTGNGFDDNCNGLVDEGCTCPGNGQTKDCYEVPPSQANPATHLPVGWCTDNSKGSLDCAGVEFPKWSGICRGAQPPYQHDVCAPGDFNCDGLPENSDTQDCSCKAVTVTCPTTPITEAPYPNPTAIQLIDGSQWVDATDRPSTKNWMWTVIGGDCDNVLPNPTFSIYNQANSVAAGAFLGTRTPVQFSAAANPARYVSTPGQPLVAMQAAAYGNGVMGGQVYPAFGLSGDYIVQGEFDLNGTHYSCTQKVQVRAPGIRAELCWDTVGGDESGNPAGNDIDLHFAQQQYKGAPTSCGTNGWEANCPLGATYQDCWYADQSGCRDGSAAPGPDWGYPTSADSACIGWSSKRAATGPLTLGCTNPRLDKDNITCDKGVTDPTSAAFCGPENINLDNPKDGDAFVVAVNHYANHGGTSNAKTHVNLYCNGQRVISVGYNPVTGQNNFPVLQTPGNDSTGDYWIAATLRAHVAGGQITTCDVATIPSHNPDPNRDGPGNGVCVESTQNASTPSFSYTNHQFVENTALQSVPNGSLPATSPEWCKH